MTADSTYLQPLAGGRSEAMEGMRGLGVLAVIGVHCLHVGGLFRSGLPLDRFFHHLVFSGWVSVDLFFALSGYLITDILVRAQGKPGWVKTFYMRRVLRVFPLFFAYLLAIHLLLPSLSFDLLGPAKAQWPYHFLFGSNLLGAFYGWPPRATQHLWTLAVEEQYYLLWPSVIALLSRRAAMLLCCAMLATSTGLRLYAELQFAPVPETWYTLTWMRWDGLAWGSLGALAVHSGPNWLRRRSLWKGMLLAALLSLPLFWVPGSGIGPWKGLQAALGFLILPMGCGAAVALCVGRDSHPFVRRTVGLPPLRFVGRLSYAVYMVHMAVIHTLSYPGGPLVRQGSAPIVSTAIPHFILGYGLVVAVSIILAWLSWHAVESPALALKDRFQPPRRQDAKAAESSPGK